MHLGAKSEISAAHMCVNEVIKATQIGCKVMQQHADRHTLCIPWMHYAVSSHHGLAYQSDGKTMTIVNLGGNVAFW